MDTKLIIELIICIVPGIIAILKHYGKEKEARMLEAAIRGVQAAFDSGKPEKVKDHIEVEAIKNRVKNPLDKRVYKVTGKETKRMRRLKK